jgi:hypothetical protein
MVEKLTETRDEAIHRLAAEAKNKGVQIFLYPRTGEYYATSTSSPDELHRVTLMSCDCPGFLRHQLCTHHAALLAELDELPPLPPTPIKATRNPYYLSDSEMVMLRGQAQRVAAKTGNPIDWYWSDPLVA